MARNPIFLTFWKTCTRFYFVAINLKQPINKFWQKIKHSHDILQQNESGGDLTQLFKQLGGSSCMPGDDLSEILKRFRNGKKLLVSRDHYGCVRIRIKYGLFNLFCKKYEMDTVTFAKLKQLMKD